MGKRERLHRKFQRTIQFVVQVQIHAAGARLIQLARPKQPRDI